VQAHETGHKRGTCEPGKTNTTNRNSEATRPGAVTKVCSETRKAQDPCNPAGWMETRAPEARPECNRSQVVLEKLVTFKQGARSTVNGILNPGKFRAT